MQYIEIALFSNSCQSGLQKIDEMAFYDFTVESIFFSKTLKKIGAQAFAFSGLTDIELPESLFQR